MFGNAVDIWSKKIAKTETLGLLLTSYTRYRPGQSSASLKKWELLNKGDQLNRTDWRTDAINDGKTSYSWMWQLTSLFIHVAEWTRIDSILLFILNNEDDFGTGDHEAIQFRLSGKDNSKPNFV